MTEPRPRSPFPLIAGALCLLAALGAAAFAFQSRPPPAPEPIRLISPTPRPSPAPTVAPSATPIPRIFVQVGGAVRQPGVYRLDAGARVQEAIAAAGGATEDANLAGFNQARRASDGEMIIVPRIGETPVPPPAGVPTTGATRATASPPQTGKININTASVAELDVLPGIGPQLAQRIVDYRQAHGPFARIEDLDNVSGIGPATVERLRDLITVQ